jgi:hypothetical protein
MSDLMIIANFHDDDVSVYIIYCSSCISHRETDFNLALVVTF